MRPFDAFNPRAILALLAAFFLALWIAEVRAGAPPLIVVLVSIDGLHPAALERGITPTLTRIAHEGVRARSLTPSFPTLTFPSHYTIVTGREPDHHGIVGNSMFDRELGRFAIKDRKAVGDGRWWDGAEPLWVTAQRHGILAATMFWPGSEAEIRGQRPRYWRPFDGRVSALRRVDQVFAWLDLAPNERPRFITLYFNDVDTAGHRHGPDAPETDRAITRVDRALARVLEGIAARDLDDEVDIVVVSDHGMASTPATQRIEIDSLIDVRAVHIVTLGALAGFNLRTRSAADVRKKLLARHEHMRCYERGRWPRRFRYGTHARVPDISCLADVGWRITRAPSALPKLDDAALGGHGYDNREPSMRGIFIARGPSFRRGVVHAGIRGVDVHPLLAALLGIEAAAGDGDAAATAAMLRRAE